MADIEAVRIKADVTDLQAKLAIAKAELASLNSEVRTQAAAMVQLGATADAEFGAELASMTGRATEAATGVAVLEKELAQATGTVEGMHGSISTATREFRALFDELSSGRTRQTPGTLAIIANRVFGLQAATLVAAIGVTALVGGLVYLAAEANNAAANLDKIKLGADFSGYVTITEETIKGFIEQLNKLPNVSEEDASKVVSAFVHMRGASEPEIRALIGMVGDYATQTGTTIDGASKTLIKTFENQKLSWKDIQTIVPTVTQAQVDYIEKLQQSGRVNEASAALIDLWREATAKQSAAVVKANSDVTGLWGTLKELFGEIGAVAAGTTYMTERVKDATKEHEKSAEAIRAEAAAMRTLTDIAPLKNAEDPKKQLQDFVSAENAKAAAYDTGSQQRLAIIRAELAKAKELHLEGTAEYFSIERELNDTIRQEAEKTARFVADLQKSSAEAYLKSEGDEVRFAREAAKQRQDIAKQEYEEKKKLQDDLTKELGVFYRNWETTARAAGRVIDQQDAEDTRRRIADERIAANEVVNVERGLTNNLLSGRMKLGQALLLAGAQFVQRELEQDIAYFTKRMLLSKTAAAADKTDALGTLAQWISTQLGLTGATETGEASRAAAKTAAIAESKAVEAAANTSSAEGYAAVAAAGAAAAVASIPYVGPAMAVAASAETFAAMQPYVALASLDVGAWNIQQDMPAFLHKGETVVPQNFAEGLRASGSLNNDNGASHNKTTTINMPVSAVDARSFQSMINDPTTMRRLATRLAVYVNSNPRTRAIVR